MVGMKEKELRDSLSKTHDLTGFRSNGDRYIGVKFDYGDFSYCIDSITNVVYMSMYIPTDAEVVNKLIESYNKYYVPTSDTTWRIYKNGNIIYIALKYSPIVSSDRYRYVFYYSIFNDLDSYKAITSVK